MKRKILKLIKILLKMYIYAMMGLVIYALFVVIYIVINGISDLVIQI